MKRQSGNYWVKRMNTWFIRYWCEISDKWYAFGVSETYDDDHFQSIGERIQEPK